MSGINNKQFLQPNESRLLDGLADVGLVDGLADVGLADELADVGLADGLADVGLADGLADIVGLSEQSNPPLCDP